jgi:MFS family permease
MMFSVFISGASLMGLELVGSRMLAPYFGNSIFVWGSLISVFLIALSGGYFIGGKISDRLPRLWFLGGIILVSGFLVIILPFVYNWVNSIIFERDFGYKWNPLLASIALFLIPSLGMGMVSPYVIRLCAKKLETIGNLAGKIYAISTVGSIVGTLGTAFFLIPLWGTKTNLFIIGGVQMLVGLVILTKSVIMRR